MPPRKRQGAGPKAGKKGRGGWRSERAYTIVIAIGGNAILRSDQKGTAEEQFGNVSATCTDVVDLVEQGNNIILTHGNGPQVGNILIQMEEARRQVPTMPLDVAVARSQGQIGYIIQQALGDELDRRGLTDKNIACIITQVLVDPLDPAFKNPTKPIGPFYSKTKAREMISKKKWKMVEIKDKGKWRRVVPSPAPIKTIERDIIRIMATNGTIVIAAGGGGIPVVRLGPRLKGVEAVIDKDRASEVLAVNVEADMLMILTDVEKVSLDYGKKEQRDLDAMTVAEAAGYLKQGHFPPGTMGPKVEAAMSFVKRTGKCAIITSTDKLIEAMDGKTGTRLLP